jgi:predicted transposase/invertase (TIGR01784 family)
MGQFDDIFKERLESKFIKVVESILKEKFQDIQPLPVELRKQLNRKADFVFEVNQADKRSLLHIEIQSKEDKQMLKRMYMYSALLYDKFDLPVKQVVFSLLEKTQMQNTLDMGYFAYSYKLVSLYEIPYKEFLKEKETLVFAILGKYERQELLNVLKNIIKTAQNKKMSKEEIRELILDLEILGKKRNLEKNIKILIPTLMPLDISLYDSPSFREAIEKGKIEGKIETAKAFLILGKNTLEEIAQATGLPLEQIQKLTQEVLHPNKKRGKA